MKPQQSPRDANLHVNATCNVNFGPAVYGDQFLDFCRRKLVFASAGAAAEAEFFGGNADTILQQQADDMDVIARVEDELRLRGVPSYDISILRHECLEEAKRIAACEKSAISAIALLAKQKDEISGTEIKVAVERSQRAPPGTPSAE